MGNQQAKHNLWVAISANDPIAVRDLVNKYPFLLNDPISDDGKTNAVTRAAYLDRPHILAELVSLGVNLNNVTGTQISALMWAAAKGHLECTKFLMNFGADPNQIGPHGMNALDFAVLYGWYNTAHYLYNSDVKPNKRPEEFALIRQDMQTLWVDHPGLLMSLDCQIPPEIAPPFTVPPIVVEPEMVDPVADPTESWGNWVKRVIDFEEPPLVERNALPRELQPQNTKIGKLKILLRMETSGPAEENIENYNSESRLDSMNLEEKKEIEMV